MKIIDFYFYVLNEITLLTNNKIEAEAEAELIFASKKFKKYFGKSLNKIDIFVTYSNSFLKKEVISYFNEILKERSEGIPIQYILDEAWFYGHEFHVYKNSITKALIPRNETELIVESFIKESKNNEFKSIYTFVGKLKDGGQNVTKDVIGTIQLEFKDWTQRRPAKAILDEIKKRSAKYAGIKVEFVELQKGPPTGKPLKLLIKSDNTSDLDDATSIIRNHLNTMVGLTNIEDDRDLPGIEWQLTVDRAQALKFGVDIALVGNYVQLITKGLKVTDYSTEVSDEEIDVVIRYPKRYRNLNQYERISIKTNKGLIPIDNFIKWSSKPKIGVIKRCLLYTSPSPRDLSTSRMPSSA